MIENGEGIEGYCLIYISRYEEKVVSSNETKFDTAELLELEERKVDFYLGRIHRESVILAALEISLPDKLWSESFYKEIKAKADSGKGDSQADSCSDGMSDAYTQILKEKTVEYTRQVINDKSSLQKVKGNVPENFAFKECFCKDKKKLKKFRPLYTDGDEKRRSDKKPSTLPLEHHRTAWRRDYGRLVHSAPFRRLQGKAQLLPGYESDYFRNRLTHSIAVAEVAKTIATRINKTPLSLIANNWQTLVKGKSKWEKEALDCYFALNKIQHDIVEISSLAHDLGHPPFGHNGEEGLHEAIKEASANKLFFEGNAQTLRIITRQSFRSQDFTDDKEDELFPLGISDGGKDLRYGLNLTNRSIASILKYDQQPETIKGNPARNCKGYYKTEQEIVEEIKKNILNGLGSNLEEFYKWEKEIKSKKEEGKENSVKSAFKTIECSIMDLADDIAYTVHDLDDAFKARLIKPSEFIRVVPF